MFPDGNIVNGQFGTWALSRFTQKRKIGLEDVRAFFTNPFISDMLDFVVCAVEQYDRQNGNATTFNDVKLCSWIDSYTEDTGEQAVLMTLFAHASGDQPEKKNLTGKEESDGLILSNMPQPQE